MSVDRPSPSPAPGSHTRPAPVAPKAPLLLGSRWGISNRRPLWWAEQVRPDGQAIPESVKYHGAWFAQNAEAYRRSYRLLEAGVLVFAAAVPVAVAADLPSVFAAGLGALAAIATGLRQSFQPQQHWADHARTRTLIEAEVVDFLNEQPPYVAGVECGSALAVRIQDITVKRSPV